MPKIKKIIADKSLTVTGIPTFEARVILDSDDVGVASFAEVKSSIAVESIRNKISPALIGMEISKQHEIDRKIIEIDNAYKLNFGENITLAVSIAVAKAGARSANLPIYLYLMQFLPKANLRSVIPTLLLDMAIRHGNPAEGSTDFSEFIIVPSSSKRLEESLRIFNVISVSLKKILESEDSSGQKISSSEQALMFLKQAIESISIQLGFDVFLGLNNKAPNFYEKLMENTNFSYFEDPFSHDDWSGWEGAAGKFPQKAIIAGCDLIDANLDRLQMALDKKAINAIVVKPSKIRTVIESLAIAYAGKAMGLKTIVSHRESGENDFMSDFAVAVSADYAKLGAFMKDENISKYNRLLQIEDQLKVL